MGRGVSSGGGQSSLDYLFGSGGEPKPTAVSTGNTESPPTQVHVAATEPPPPPKTAAPITPPDITKQIPAGIQSSKLNNYIRADGQNTGNFITVSVILWKLYFVPHISFFIKHYHTNLKISDRNGVKEKTKSKVLECNMLLIYCNVWIYRIALRPRFMLLQVEGLPWDTCLVMVRSDIFCCCKIWESSICLLSVWILGVV